MHDDVIVLCRTMHTDRYSSTLSFACPPTLCTLHCTKRIKAPSSPRQYYVCNTIRTKIVASNPSRNKPVVRRSASPSTAHTIIHVITIHLSGSHLFLGTLQTKPTEDSMHTHVLLFATYSTHNTGQ